MKQYKVMFTTLENDNEIDWDWDVLAISEEDAINKVKSGEVKGPYGQKLPKLARNFSAKLYIK